MVRTIPAMTDEGTYQQWFYGQTTDAVRVARQALAEHTPPEGVPLCGEQLVAVPSQTLLELLRCADELLDQCQAVGVPVSAAGLVRHHRGNASLSGSLKAMASGLREGAVRALAGAAALPGVSEEAAATMSVWAAEIRSEQRPVRF